MKKLALRKRIMRCSVIACALVVALCLPAMALADDDAASAEAGAKASKLDHNNLSDPLAPYGVRSFDDTRDGEEEVMLAAANEDKTSTQAGKDAGSKDKPVVDAEWVRLAGNNAIQTMAKIAAEGFESAHTVVIAASNGYWDALSASSIAGVSGCPVLLTETETLSSATAAQVKRLKPERAIICGGTASVSEKVEDQLKAAGVDIIERYAGDNAAETAVAIGKQVGTASPSCVIATVNTYHDALSIAPYAYAHQAPIYLTNTKGVLSADTVAAIKEVGHSHAMIVGGYASVKASVEGQLVEAGIDAYGRLAGPNAYATSARIAAWELEEGFLEADGIGVACGTGYWDALTGAALCGKNKSVLVLADDNNYSAAVSVMNDYSNEISKGYLFGGTESVGKVAEDKIRNGVTDMAFESIKDVRVGGYTKIGIDVSEWQRTINWTRVKNSGVDYAIIRVGYGDDEEKYDDLCFLQNVKGALLAGVPIGVYIYSYAEDVEDANSEADHMLRLLKKAGLLPGSLAYGVWYDLEDPSMADTKNVGVLYNIAKTFNTRMTQAGYTPGVYANLNWWTHFLTNKGFDAWDRWVAQYNTSCTYSGDYCMWQCKSTGAIDGIVGNVDMNLYYR